MPTAARPLHLPLHRHVYQAWTLLARQWGQMYARTSRARSENRPRRSPPPTAPEGKEGEELLATERELRLQRLFAQALPAAPSSRRQSPEREEAPPRERAEAVEAGLAGEPAGEARPPAPRTAAPRQNSVASEANRGALRPKPSPGRQVLVFLIRAVSALCHLAFLLGLTMISLAGPMSQGIAAAAGTGWGVFQNAAASVTRAASAPRDGTSATSPTGPASNINVMCYYPSPMDCPDAGTPQDGKGSAAGTTHPRRAPGRWVSDTEWRAIVAAMRRGDAPPPPSFSPPAPPGDPAPSPGPLPAGPGDEKTAPSPTPEGPSGHPAAKSDPGLSWETLLQDVTSNPYVVPGVMRAVERVIESPAAASVMVTLTGPLFGAWKLMTRLQSHFEVGTTTQTVRFAT